MATVGTIRTITDLSGNTYNIHGILYGECYTVAETQAKTVDIPGITNLSKGLSIRVRFSYAQLYSGTPTLNVNNLGAKDIRRTSASNASLYMWDAYEILDLVYDGTYWVIVDGGLATTSRYGATILLSSATSGSSTHALTPISLNYTVANMIANYPIYSTSGTYAVGDRVRYSYNLYECNTAITTAEAWTAAHWTKLPTLIDMIESGGRVLPSVTSSDNGKVLQVSNGEWKAIDIAIIGDINSVPIASFSDAMPTNAIDVTIDIDPVQDLHGYDNPWPAGGNVNLLPYNVAVGTQTINGVTWDLHEDGSVSISGIATEASTFRYVYNTTEFGPYFSGNYKFYAFPGNIGTSVFQGGIKIGTKWYSVYANSRCNISDADGQISEVWFQVRAGQTLNATVYPMIYSAEITAPTSWTPYSNICPISGWTGANVTRTGKNLFDKETAGIGFIVGNSGQVEPNRNYKHSDYIYVIPGMTYSITNTGFSGANGGAYYDISKNYVREFRVPSFPASFTVPSGCYYMRFSIEPIYLDTIQLELGSTATAYEPYTGTTYPITFPSEAGTIYGGTLDVTTGLLTVDRAMVDMGTLTWTYYVSGLTFYAQVSDAKIGISNVGLICSRYTKYIGAGGASMGVNADKVIAFGASNNYVYVADSSYTDAATFKSAMSGVQLVYELATPQTYQLTPIEVTLLLGDNNVWADTGNIFIKYRRQDSLGINENIATMSEFKSYFGIT